MAQPADGVAALRARGVRLELFTIGWMIVEAGGAVTAGVLANSIALMGFGLDSVIELFAALLVLGRLRAQLAGGRTNEQAESRALRAIAVSFFVLAAYVLAEASLHLYGHQKPNTSVLGITITAAALIVMPILSRAKRRTGKRLQNRLLIADAAETKLCALLALTTLLGLLLFSIFGWWWADPIASLAIVYFAIREGREAWEGELFCDDE